MKVEESEKNLYSDFITSTLKHLAVLWSGYWMRSKSEDCEFNGNKNENIHKLRHMDPN